MMTLGLPMTAEIGGKDYKIRADFRDIIEILIMMSDPDMPNKDKAIAAMMMFYPDYDEIPAADYEEAIKWCYWFIDGGDRMTGKHGPRLMDWEQDYAYIIAPVNRVLGYESRSTEFLHWWTFLSAYMEIGDCTFARIVGIRHRKKKGKKLDKADQEFYNENRAVIDLKTKTTAEEEQIMKEWGGTS